MQNGTMIQFFHWYTPADGSLWKQVKDQAKRLAELGITSIWLPPAFKGSRGVNSEGYDLYDMYDLGEFDQKGTVRTKYGTKQEYLDAINSIQQAGIQVYVDIITNHFSGADETEKVTVRRVNPENRNEFISEPFEIEAFTKFSFPGRKGKYSQFIWDYRCFSGVDFANDTGEKGIFTIANEYGDNWEPVVDTEKGNYDYLMGADIEFRNPAVREEFKRWGEWYSKLTNFDGVRLDAVKHVTPEFFKEFLYHLRSVTNKEIFAVGEYWAPGNLDILLKYIDASNGEMSLFDAALHQNLHLASQSGKDYDLTGIFKQTLVEAKPELAVTVTDNHDTQPLQMLEAPVEPWFKPLAYALILLRKQGYPCIFYPDLYGANYTDKGHDGSDHDIWLPAVENIEKLIVARKLFVYGMQRDYFDHANCIGWTLEGDEEHANSGCAIVLSNGDEGTKHMEIGKRHAGRKFIDYLGKHLGEIIIDEGGWATFSCAAGSVSVWVAK